MNAEQAAARNSERITELERRAEIQRLEGNELQRLIDKLEKKLDARIGEIVLDGNNESERLDALAYRLDTVTGRLTREEGDRDRKDSDLEDDIRRVDDRVTDLESKVYRLDRGS